MEKIQIQEKNKTLNSQSKIVCDNETTPNQSLISLEVNNEWDNVLNFKVSKFIDWDMRKG